MRTVSVIANAEKQIRELAQAGLEICLGRVVPSPAAIFPNSAPDPVAYTTAVPSPS